MKFYDEDKKTRLKSISAEDVHNGVLIIPESVVEIGAHIDRENDFTFNLTLDDEDKNDEISVADMVKKVIMKNNVKHIEMFAFERF
ncbi:MAG: hypothetical protein IJH12_03120 [Clostridia bacterium]|nr:hypothetical protein [Clostridia bacterium]